MRDTHAEPRGSDTGRARRTTRRQRRLRGRRRDGRLGEALARWWLRLHGWSITGRNVRIAAVEIDVLARRHRVEALVEVKTRRMRGARGRPVEPQHLISPSQRRRLRRALEARAEAASAEGSRRVLRADLVEVLLGAGLPRLRHHVDVAAWDR